MSGSIFSTLSTLLLIKTLITINGVEATITPANEHIRSVAVTGLDGGPTADVDITVSPDLSVIRIGNRGNAKVVDVRAFGVNKQTLDYKKKDKSGLNLPKNHDLVVAVEDWMDVKMTVKVVSFE